jgi:pyruvate,orthophosphate dikinase
MCITYFKLISFCLYLYADPKQQLQLAVKAVFESWDSPRANKYRSINQITGLKGTAVNIQCMVFGNMGNTSGTGVLFTRNPSTGEKKLYGEFLINAQVLCAAPILSLL